MGLSAGAYLAKAGVDTILVEARDSVEDVPQPVSDLGARFNICACDHSLIRAMPLIDELNLSFHGLDYLEPEATYVNAFHENNGSWVFYHDADKQSMGYQSHIHPKLRTTSDIWKMRYQ